MRVLVTGGAGYIGSHTCKALQRAGHLPVAFDNLSRGHADAVKWGPLVVGDVLDLDGLVQALEVHEIEAVVHMAGLAYVGESMSDPHLYYENNVVGSFRVLEAMRLKGVQEIVFSSSCATYGIPDQLPLRESSPQNPISTYGFTKLSIERMLQDYTRAYGFRAVALRYFNAAGADADGEVGERHDPETHAVPCAIMAALGLGPPFEIYGAAFATPDGTAVRDYVHVADLADAHVKAIELASTGQLDFAYNLATGCGASIQQLLAAVAHVIGRDVPTVISAPRAGDPPMLYADYGHARRDLGWEPKYVDLQSIVQTAADWLRRPMALAHPESHGAKVPWK